MKAVLLIGGFSTSMRPLTLTLPLPLLDFCNQTLLFHQLRALKEAGITEVIISYFDKQLPSSWDESVKKHEELLQMRITLSKEDQMMGTAGPLKHAEALITDNGTNDTPFIVVNSDVLCSYPLRDLLHLHNKHGREGTVLTTRADCPSAYGVVVCDERTGRILHFVEKPETFVSDMINGGVYVFSPAIFKRIPAGRPVSMNELLPVMALEEQLQSMLLTGYWVKLTNTASYMEAVRAHLDILRFMDPSLLISRAEGYTVKGSVMVHPSAKIGSGCVLGPSVVVGEGCTVEDGVRLEGSTLLQGTRVQSHSVVKDSLIGWSSNIGKWCFVTSSVFGSGVSVQDTLLINGATVLSDKDLSTNIREPEIVI